jgi:hypothetical protein
MRDSKKRPREQTGNGMVRPCACPLANDVGMGRVSNEAPLRPTKSIARLAAHAGLLARQGRKPMVHPANESGWRRAIRSGQEIVRVLTIMRADE